MANFLLPLIKRGDRPYELRNGRTGRSIAQDVIAAFEPAARRKGLLGRDSFAKGSAMVIAPSNAIHTFWMRFAIDALFVRRDGTVVKVCRNLVPWRMAAALWAYAVIELPAGTLAADDASVGDVLTVVAVAECAVEAAESAVEAPALARVG
jgi:uncharacterized membrane protein (UPF0127 family)